VAANNSGGTFCGRTLLAFVDRNTKASCITIASGARLRILVDAFSSEIRQKLDATECAASGKEANQGSTFPVAW
jgi:hypothetical protein